MRSTIIAAALAAAIIGHAPEAGAQVVAGTTYRAASSYTGPAGVSYVYNIAGDRVGLPVYSYYGAYPYAARQYVPLNEGSAGNFPYHGQPYGRVYDPWTWPYMGGGYTRALSHYYYPPL